MDDAESYFSWSGVHLEHYYLYFAACALIAFYLVRKSNAINKIELFFLSFYLLTGSLNKLLKIKIPGFSFFEIQPLRFLFFMFSFYLIRKVFFSREKVTFGSNGQIPWFMLMLYLHVFFVIIAQFVNFNVIGFDPVVINIVYALNFLAIILSLRLIENRDFYEVIRKTIL